MGMASSDDDGAIMAEHYLMEKIRDMHPEYASVTYNMNEDMKIIYDHSLKSKFLKTDAYAPTLEHYDTRASKTSRSSPGRYSQYESPAPEVKKEEAGEGEDEDDKKIKYLKKKIEIAKLEKELRELTGK